MRTLYKLNGNSRNSEIEFTASDDDLNITLHDDDDDPSEDYMDLEEAELLLERLTEVVEEIRVNRIDAKEEPVK